MGQAAVRAAKAIGYRGAGTVEFIVDGSRGLRPDGFWFMEMNTRLQVEHPVTEAVTGIDLVAWQLRVAAGEGLPLRQEEIPLRGHAFEARLYVEDVAAGFLPATGRLAHLAFPEGARVDTGVRAGDVISPWYDPMIAKIITHGPTRAVALRRLEAALAGTEVAGTVTNLEFLGALARHEGFGAGAVDTGLIGRDLEDLCAVAAPAGWEWAAAAGLALGLEGIRDPLAGFALSGRVWRELRLIREEEERALRVCVTGPGAAVVAVEGVEIGVWARPGGLRVDGAPGLVRGVRIGAEITLFGAAVRRFVQPDPLARRAAPGADADLVVAPMPGLVKAVFVAAGDVVAEGARLAVLEAMKMEHVLAAARAGIVAEVLVAEGAQIEAGAAMVRLQDGD
jgi:3-methylcrotonyl-CoA carboxylase alpha subunit